MNKLQMAHQMALMLLKNAPLEEVSNAISTAWQYADAMQAEADKREPSGFPNVLRGACGEIVAVKVDGKEWQPDWDLAPSDATTWKTVNNVAIWLSSNGQPLCTAPTFGITGCLVVERPQ